MALSFLQYFLPNLLAGMGNAGDVFAKYFAQQGEREREDQLQVSAEERARRKMLEQTEANRQELMLRHNLGLAELTARGEQAKELDTQLRAGEMEDLLAKRALPLTSQEQANLELTRTQTGAIHGPDYEAEVRKDKWRYALFEAKKTAQEAYLKSLDLSSIGSSVEAQGAQNLANLGWGEVEYYAKLLEIEPPIAPWDQTPEPKLGEEEYGPAGPLQTLMGGVQARPQYAPLTAPGAGAMRPTGGGMGGALEALTAPAAAPQPQDVPAMSALGQQMSIGDPYQPGDSPQAYAAKLKATGYSQAEALRLMQVHFPNIPIQ